MPSFVSSQAFSRKLLFGLKDCFSNLKNFFVYNFYLKEKNRYKKLEFDFTSGLILGKIWKGWNFQENSDKDLENVKTV